MCSRSWFVFALLATLAGALGCKQDRRVADHVGGIDFVIRSTDDARTLGTFTVRRADGRVAWRLPLRGDGFRTSRLVLEPGMYALDFEVDVMAALAHPGSEMPVRLAGGTLPRWVVVAPARVTTVHVTTELETNALSVAALRDAPPPSLRVNVN